MAITQKLSTSINGHPISHSPLSMLACDDFAVKEADVHPKALKDVQCPHCDFGECEENIYSVHRKTNCIDVIA